MRVLLVHPGPLMYSEVFVRLEPLGIEIAGASACRAGHQVRLLDLQTSTHRELDGLLAAWKPDAVGFSLNRSDSEPGIPYVLSAWAALAHRNPSRDGHRLNHGDTGGNGMQTQAIIGAVLACAGILAPLGHAQAPVRQDERTQSLLNRSVVYSDRFERSLGEAVKHSSFKDSHLAARLDDWSKYMHKELKEAAHNYREGGPYAVSPGTHLQNALVAAQGINRAMIGEAFAPIVEQDWAALRGDLNQLAAVWNRPPIPVSGAEFIPARQQPLGTAETGVLLQNIHEQAGRFKDHFDHAAGRYRVVGENSGFYKSIASGLDDATGRAAGDFRNNDMRKFHINLEDTFVLAAAMNRTMAETQFSPMLQAEWNSLRTNLNTLAIANGFPPLPEFYQQTYVTD